MADLINKMGDEAEVETLFFGKEVEASKKRCQQNVYLDNYMIEREISLRKN